MELRRYLQTLRRRWPVVILSVAVAAAIAVVVSPSKVTRYTATSTVLAAWEQQPGQSFSLADQAIGVNALLPTYARLVDTLPVAQAAVSASGVPRTAGQVVAETLASPIAGTQLISISVIDSSSSVAQRLSGAMAQAFASSTGGPAGRTTSPSLSFTVAAPAASTNASTSGGMGKSLGVAAIFGLLVALVLVFLVDYADPTLRDGDAAEEALGAPLLGVVPPLGASQSFLPDRVGEVQPRLPVPSSES